MQSILVPITLFGWIPLAVGLFAVLPPRRAVLVSFLTAWLFLPQAAMTFEGWPDLTKITATSLGALLGAALFDTPRLLGYRIRWIDLPIIVWCAVPMASSLSNGLGAYDGLSTCAGAVLTWGVPYLLGRLYLNDLQAIRELAVTLLIGGLIYVPFCLFEIRMSPQLHRLVYGFHQHQFAQTIRFGGYRPMVFMQHGLMVGLWMTSASLIGVWLWRTGALRRVLGAPVSLAVPVLLVTTVLCKSVGALALLAGGLAMLFATRRFTARWLVVAAVMIAPAYIAVRLDGQWQGEQLVAIAEHIDEDRARSLEGRYSSEGVLLKRAWEKPLLGWGASDAWRELDEDEPREVAADALWLIAFARHGAMGTAAVTLAVLLPVLLLLRRAPLRFWSTAAVAPAAALAVVLLVCSLDNLLNAMVNPIYLLGAGALSGLYVATSKRELLEPDLLWSGATSLMPGPASTARPA